MHLSSKKYFFFVMLFSALALVSFQNCGQGNLKGKLGLGSKSKSGGYDLSQVGVNPSCMSDSIHTHRVDINTDLAEQGKLFFDALSTDCADTAALKLYQKTRATLDETTHTDAQGRTKGPFQGWLEGVNVSMIFTTSLVLGGKDKLAEEMVIALKEIEQVYEIGLDDWCGTNFENTCLDDYSQAAAAYGWMAAFEKLRGDSTKSMNLANLAHHNIRLFYAYASNLCHKNGDMSVMPRVCQASDFSGGQFEVLSFNHGYENIPYALGLVSSIASASVGLEIAGSRHILNSEELNIAKGLLKRGQERTLPDGSKFFDGVTHTPGCYRVSGSTLTADADCAEANMQYRPKMFPVFNYYKNYVIEPTQDFKFDTIDNSLFSASHNFYSLGRKAVYYIFGGEWLVASNRPRLAAGNGTGEPLRLSPPKNLRLSSVPFYQNQLMNLVWDQPENSEGKQLEYYVLISPVSAPPPPAIITRNTWYTLPKTMPTGSYNWSVNARVVDTPENTSDRVFGPQFTVLSEPIVGDLNSNGCIDHGSSNEIGKILQLSAGKVSCCPGLSPWKYNARNPIGQQNLTTSDGAPGFQCWWATCVTAGGYLRDVGGPQYPCCDGLTADGNLQCQAPQPAISVNIDAAAPASVVNWWPNHDCRNLIVATAIVNGSTPSINVQATLDNDFVKECNGPVNQDGKAWCELSQIDNTKKYKLKASAAGATYEIEYGPWNCP